MGLVQQLRLQLDRGASARLIADMRTAGAESTAALQAEFKRKIGDIRHDMAAGFLTKAEASKKGEEVAQAYNAAVIERIKALTSAGTLSTNEYNKLTASLKLAGKTGGESASLLSKAWGGFKTLITGFARLSRPRSPCAPSSTSRRRASRRPTTPTIPGATWARRSGM